MDLVRNQTGNGHGKYAIVKLQLLATQPTTAQELAAAIRANPEAVSFGEKATAGEFFVTMLKDEHAEAGLIGYSDSAAQSDPQYAAQIRELAARAGKNSPFCKKPD